MKVVQVHDRSKPPSDVIIKIFTKSFPFWFGLHCILMNYFSLTFSYALLHKGLENLEAWTEFIQTVPLAITIDVLFLFRRRKISNFLEKMKIFFLSLPTAKQNSLKRNFACWSTFTWVCSMASIISVCAVHICGASGNFLRLSNEYTMHSMAFGLNYSTVDNYDQKSFLILLFCGYRFCFAGLWIVFPGIYITFCYLLSENIQRFQFSVTWLNVSSMCLRPGDILCLHKRFKTVADMILEFNDIFNELVFVWYGISLLKICRTTITTLLTLPVYPTIVEIFYFETIHVAIIVTVVSGVASKIPPKRNQCILLLHDLQVEARYQPSVEFHSELWLFLQRISVSLLGACIGKNFVIDEKFSVSYAGAVVTLVTICLQLDPKIMSPLRTQSVN